MRKIDRNPVCLCPNRIAWGLFLATGAMVLLGLGADLVFLTDPRHPSVLLAMELFNPDREMNIFTWYNTGLLLLNGVFLFVLSALWRRDDRKLARGLTLLGGLFLLLSLDEMVSIHEWVGRELGTLLLGREVVFLWLIPAAVVVGIAVAVLLPLLWRLPRRVLTVMVISGVVYLLGAMGMEAFGWYLMVSRGEWSIGYLFSTWVEESLEITGLTIFLFAQLLAAAASGQSLVLVSRADLSPEPQEASAPSRQARPPR